jgi:uncharacterized membrane protein
MATAGKIVFAVLFIFAGTLHFIATPLYAKIMPPYLPHPISLVQISGIAEILGGIGLLFPPTRKSAAWSLIALLICVMPANVQMAMDHVKWPAIPEWALWARLPIQIPLIAWAWLYTKS